MPSFKRVGMELADANYKRNLLAMGFKACKACSDEENEVFHFSKDCPWFPRLTQDARRAHNPELDYEDDAS